MSYLKAHWQLLTLLAAVFALWQTPVVLPLKILVVFMHELSHGLAAILTGGEIVELSLSPQQGGHAVTRGGSRFLILSAGYLGSLLLGVALLAIALRTKADRAAMMVCGVIMLGVTLLYIRDLFPVVFCTLSGLAMCAMAKFLSHQINDMALRVIGLSSVIYVPYDIFDDTIRRSNLQSDAYMLADHVGGPTLFWGGLWLLLSLIVVLFCLRFTLAQSSNLEWRAPSQG